MTETNILDLYWRRSEDAIYETDIKYGSYCYTVAYNILYNREDSEESVSDTYLRTWNSIPPQSPNSLKAFLGKICRHISISRFRQRNAIKRGGGEMMLAIDELKECVPSASDIHKEIEQMELLSCLNSFLDALPERECNIFVARYWYSLSIERISEKFRIKENTVKTILFRTRQKLLQYLEKEGY